MTEQTPSAPAGWYPDPQVPGQQRYWDGAAWAASQTPPSAPPVATPGKKKPRKALAFALVGVGALIVLIAVIAAVGGAGKDTNAAKLAGGGATATPPASSSSSTSDDSPAAAVPKTSDFKVGVKVRSKQCFGSAGCNITYRIAVSYSGSHLDQSYDVTYEVRGDESGPQTDTFTIDPDGTVTYNEGVASTKSRGVVLKTRVLSLEPSSP